MSSTQEDYPVLISIKPIKIEFSQFKKININSENDFSIGRALHNSVVIPSIAISRNHCKFKKENDNWVIEDYSSYGVEVNGIKVGKGNNKILSNDDLINFDSLKEFMYKFTITNCYIAHKKIKLEVDQNCSIIDDVKTKFEESQNIEIQHVKEKIQKHKQLQLTNELSRDQVYEQTNIKVEQLVQGFDLQIENLKGEKDDIERHKTQLIEERVAQVAALKNELDTKTTNLLNQIRKHREKELALVIENKSLKEKLLTEREDFLAELDKENSYKQDLLNNLQEKIRKQEEMHLKEKEELDNLLQMEKEKLRLAKDKELNELVELNKQRELEILEEHNKVKQGLEKEIEKMKEEKRNAKRKHKVLQTPQEQFDVVVVDEEQTLNEEAETAVAGPSSASPKPLDKIRKLMETELQCSICSEIFDSPILLNCGHTFCKYCINSWKKKKKNCPICRTKIKHECRSIAMESFLEKILPNLSHEMKKKSGETSKSTEAEQRAKARASRRGRTARWRSGPRTARRSPGRSPGSPSNSTTTSTNYNLSTQQTSRAIPTVDLTSIPFSIPITMLPHEVIVIEDEATASRAARHTAATSVAQEGDSCLP